MLRDMPTSQRKAQFLTSCDYAGLLVSYVHALHTYTVAYRRYISSLCARYSLYYCYLAILTPSLTLINVFIEFQVRII